MNWNEELRPRWKRGRRWMFAIPFVIAAFVLARSALVMLLWNTLLPDLFRAPEITLLQALGLVVLAKLLVGFGHFGRHGGPPWKRHMAALTPEEKEKIREKIFNKKCGGHHE